MNNFEKIYVDGVPTEKEIIIEDSIIARHKKIVEEMAKEICVNEIVIDLRNKEPEKPIAGRKGNSRRAIKKSSTRSDKV